MPGGAMCRPMILNICPMNPPGVQFASADVEQVTGRVRGEAVRASLGGAQQLAQLGQAHLQAGRRLVRRLPRPQFIDELIG